MGMCKPVFCTDSDRIVKLIDFCTCFYKFCTDCLHVLWDEIFNKYITSGSSGSNHISSCFYHIGYDGILASMKLFYSNYPYYISTGSLYVSTHTIEEVSHIYHMRLLSHIFHYGLTLCKGSSKHGIDSSTYTGHIKVDMITGQFISSYSYKAVFNVNFCTKSFKTFDMLVYRTAAYITATGKGNLSIFILAKECSE